MKWIKRIAVALGILLAILAAVPFLITLDDYIPRIEKEASAKLKEPVSIKQLRFSALPLPHLKVDGITVGKTGDLKVGKVIVHPDVWSLMDPVKVITSIDIEDLVLTQKAADRIPEWAAGDAKPGGPAKAAPVRVQSIRLSNATIRLTKLHFGPFDARISLDNAGKPANASILTQDGKLKAYIKPDKPDFYLIDISAQLWQLPVGPAIVFDELHVKGIATSKQLQFGDMRAKLYGGSAEGRAELAWQKGMQLKGNVTVRQVELKSLVPLFSPKTRMSGRLDAKPVFSASAPSGAKLLDELRLDTPFNVQNGVYYGVDLQKAATSFTKDEAGGGETRFNELSGNFALDRGTQHLTNLKIASGSYAASGHVTISPQKELSGRINAEITAAKLTAASVPLNVSGTVASPVLFPTAAFLAGAAAGTAVLGPGLGTTVGAKVGGWVDSLFGSGDEKKPPEK